MGSVNVLTRFLDCTDSVESESLLEQLVWEQSAPVVEKIVASKIHGPLGEDVRSEVLADLISRLREWKQSGEREEIVDFRAYSAVAAYHGCDGHFRRLFPQRHRLENQLRYLLGKHVRLALWQAHDGKWTCGDKTWRSRQPLTTVHRKITVWASSRAAARVVEKILDESGGQLPFDDLVEQVAKHWRISDHAAPPGEDYALPTSSVETKLTQRGWLRQLWTEIIALPTTQRSSLLLNMRDESGDAALPLFPATGVANLSQIASVLEIPVGELERLWDGLPLDDLRIAARLGVTRQHVIDLRRSARLRLSRC
ncbi:MAG TPA: hypothetical protein VK686_16930 [Bryobacteraceae bacterium]|jgi:hypothetical protein|nr:hypothetical protein [Bryobacteraceae bacterium]